MPTLTAKQIHRDSRKMLGRSPEVIKSFNETLPRSSDRLRQAVRVFNGIHASPAYQRRASFTAHVHAFNVSTDARSILHDLRTSFTVLGRFSSGDGRRLFRARYEIPPDGSRRMRNFVHMLCEPLQRNSSKFAIKSLYRAFFSESLSFRLWSYEWRNFVNFSGKESSNFCKEM